jgi:hypothetical protein
MIGRLIASVGAIVLYGWAFAFYSPQATLISGQAAGRQFENSDGGYLSAVYTFSTLSGIGAIATGLLVLVLIGIWARPARRFVRWMSAAAAVLFLLYPADAGAFFEKADKTEAYTIMPNESAFWIPDVGANKETQAQLESESYLNEKKLAVKRFIIPHQKLSNSGGYMAWDYYVPTGRLIILDRTPFSREWVDSEDRGTSKTKEGFPCQSKEGLNIIAGVSIGTSVPEKEAAKFLYNFGVTPPKGDRTSGEVIFTSVYYGRSLREVMDDVGRKKVQTLVCSEISRRTFDEVNSQSSDIMVAVEDAARKYFAAVGITLDFIGYGDTFEFDKDIQKVVNDKYATEKLAKSMDLLQALAQLKVQEGLGAGLASKGLPIVVTPDMINALIGMVKSPAPVAAPAQ